MRRLTLSHCCMRMNFFVSLRVVITITSCVGVGGCGCTSFCFFVTLFCLSSRRHLNHVLCGCVCVCARLSLSLSLNLSLSHTHTLYLSVCVQNFLLYLHVVLRERSLSLSLSLCVCVCVCVSRSLSLALRAPSLALAPSLSLSPSLSLPLSPSRTRSRTHAARSLAFSLAHSLTDCGAEMLRSSHHHCVDHIIIRGEGERSQNVSKTQHRQYARENTHTLIECTTTYACACKSVCAFTLHERACGRVCVRGCAPVRVRE